MKRRIGALIAAAAIVFGVIGQASAVTGYGVTVQSASAFKVSSTNVQGTAYISGRPNQYKVYAQVRLLKNGSQAGSVTTYSLSPSVNYGFNGSASYACSGLGLSTFVVQSRLVLSTANGPLVTTWDNGPGKNIYCS